MHWNSPDRVPASNDFQLKEGRQATAHSTFDMIPVLDFGGSHSEGSDDTKKRINGLDGEAGQH